MKRLITLILFISAICVARISAQNIEISGNLIEADTGEEVPFATVMLLNETDSTLLEYAISGTDGHFVFKNVKNRDYLLKISHITYTPYQKHIKKTDGKSINLGNLKLSPIAEVLMEVVVHEAQAPLLFKGDTVEYNAATFKVAPGSTVEDLLKKLPGIEVDADGGIKSMGKDVSKVYVDGKNFFGDDPKMVTQNIDAEAVSKVQVYNDKSEQEKLTGIKDGTQNKVMNLELKQEYKKGYFGKASVGAGWGDGNFIPWLAKGSFNRFNDKYQLSVIGYGNDINSTRTDWEDMQEFKGSSAFTHDNGDFGFGNGGWWGGFGSNLYWDGNGFAQNYGGGVNFNYDDGKTILYTNYTYNQINSKADIFANQKTMLTDTSYFMTDTSYNANKNFSHSVSARLEEKIDSLDYIIGRINVKFTGTRKNNNNVALYQGGNLDLINQYSEISDSKLNNINTDALVIYNHKFMKPKRSFSISAENNNTIALEKENEENINDFFNATTEDERIKVASSQNKNTNNLKSSVMYVEPIGKRFTFSTFYNFAMNTEKLSHEAQDELQSNAAIDSLSLISQRDLFYNRLGVAFAYSFNGLYINAGAAYKNLQQNGKYTRANINGDPLRRNYGSVIPYFEINWESPNNIWLSFDYSYDIEEPDFTYLQPISTNMDPLYVVNGNPNLSYTSEHNTSAMFGYHNRASFMGAFVSADYTYQPDLITYNQKIEYVDGLGYRNVRTPEIVHGGHEAGANIHLELPIVKSKFTTSLGFRYGYDQNPIFINGVENLSQSNSFNPNITFQINLSDKLTWRINGRYGYTTTTYKSENYFNNNKTTNYNVGTSIKWQMFGRTYLEANYKYNKYLNNEFTNNPDMHILNVSIKQYLGKGNKFELRLAACDLLNQSVSIAQYASSNTVYYRESPTLSRYYMLTFSYNMKGFQDKGRRGVDMMDF